MVIAVADIMDLDEDDVNGGCDFDQVARQGWW
jgi:hypothetical protein